MSQNVKDQHALMWRLVLLSNAQSIYAYSECKGADLERGKKKDDFLWFLFVYIYFLYPFTCMQKNRIIYQLFVEDNV